MNISTVNSSSTVDTKLKSAKMGVLVAQRSLEAARQNQEGGSGADGTSNAKRFAHPFLGHNVDIYV
jgi:hypothetical protein